MHVIDIHFHVVPPLLVEALRRGDFKGVIETDRSRDIEWFVFTAPPGVPVEPETELEECAYVPELILKALDERHLTAAAISPPPELFAYWLEPETGVRFTRLVNDGMAALALQHPDRFIPLATLPMQDVPAAVAELERAVLQLGMRGAAICTHVNDIDLDDARFAPVFACAEKLGVPVFLHPQNSGDMRRLKDMHLWNTVGFPFETALTASRLIMGGVFERFPGLNVILAHGGGYFPYQVARLDHAYGKRAKLREGLPHRPSYYLRNIYCDGLLHDPLSLQFLIDRVGADHVVLGCDYSFGMGTATAVKSLRELGLPAAQERAILGGTLARLLKIESKQSQVLEKVQS
ncbi:amidohydrolase [Terrihabitans soli]|uniref:Amidohydrolase n=1 Tax=Terrihabitans soli TaxID=708113 RepID=A0A6S6QK60_9HYPH|nr:amidohydrolase family protein [Terrihabitans soli]BCJ89626.1 amidohydrolase [Terrihabitans soli]